MKRLLKKIRKIFKNEILKIDKEALIFQTGFKIIFKNNCTAIVCKLKKAPHTYTVNTFDPKGKEIWLLKNIIERLKGIPIVQEEKVISELALLAFRDTPFKLMELEIFGNNSE